MRKLIISLLILIIMVYGCGAPASQIENSDDIYADDGHVDDIAQDDAIVDAPLPVTPVVDSGTDTLVEDISTLDEELTDEEVDVTLEDVDSVLEDW